MSTARLFSLHLNPNEACNTPVVTGVRHGTRVLYATASTTYAITKTHSMGVVNVFLRSNSNYILRRPVAVIKAKSPMETLDHVGGTVVVPQRCKVSPIGLNT